MAMIKTTRRGWFGLRRSTISGPSSEGTKAAFEIGAEAFKKAGGAKPGLKHAIAMHRANTAVTRG
jgi:hypothetical protein